MTVDAGDWGAGGFDRDELDDLRAEARRDALDELDPQERAEQARSDARRAAVRVAGDRRRAAMRRQRASDPDDG